MVAKAEIILITGCNGRIGSAVMRRFRETFDNVVGLDRNAPTQPPPGCVRIPVDIASDESVRVGLRVLREHHGNRIAAVVHLAAYYDFLGEPSPLYDEITVEGTRRLLRGLRDGFEVGQFVFSSTMLVHRPAEPGEFINEDWPLGPTWAYPESKVRTEALIHEERGDIRAVILRLAGVYDDVCHSPPLANQIQRLYERQLAGHLFSGSTAHGQAYVHLDDVVEAIERAVMRRAKLPPEVAILIGEAETLSYDELQHTFQRLIGEDSSETQNVPALIAKPGAWIQDHIPGQNPFIKPWMIDRANDQYALDISRARKLLGWQPRHSLRETMPKMVAALKADPLGWYREHGLELTPFLERQAERAASKALAKPTAQASPVYVCPMHSTVAQDLPGNCPRCGTALEPTVRQDRPGGSRIRALLFRAGVLPSVAAWIAILAVFGAAAALAFVYSGFFNVAATVEDAPPLRWLLVTTREASVRRHARAIEVPKLDGPSRVENGFRIFREQCAMCHTPPGGQTTWMSQGLNPEAPPLAELAGDMTDAELFWVTENGIRFTGMPAWAPSHNEQDLWDVVAFMRKSANMTAADLDALDRRVPREPQAK